MSADLRHGYTTGSTAAAAAKAAMRLLLGAAEASATLRLPWKAADAQPVSFSCESFRVGPGFAEAGVRKDGGDDPDATHGMEIRATVYFTDGDNIDIEGGEGIGRVTKPGLATPVGKAAINPVPLEMIESAVRDALRSAGVEGRGVKVVISAPEGAERATRTMNARLGVVGGISILGTTGIVIPMSTAAWTATIDACLDIACAAGATRALLAFGRTSERAGHALYPELAEFAAVLMGDHVGYSLDAAAARGLDVVIVGQFAKFCKLASGSYKTHVKDSTLDLNLLASLMASAGFSTAECERALSANTAREVFNSLRAVGDRGVFALLADAVSQMASARVSGSIAVETALFDYAGALIAQSSKARREKTP